VQVLGPTLPRPCSGSKTVWWHIVNVTQRKKATTAIPVFHFLDELIELAFPGNAMEKEFTTMKLVVTILCKALFVKNGTQATMLTHQLYAIWPTMDDLFRDIFMKHPTLKDIPAFFELFLVHRAQAHLTVGMKLESDHGITKKGYPIMPSHSDMCRLRLQHSKCTT